MHFFYVANMLSFLSVEIFCAHPYIYTIYTLRVNPESDEEVT